MRQILFLAVLMFPSSVQAYIGPGLGTGTIAVVLGIFASIILAFVAIVWYPLKRLFKLLFNKDKTSTASASETTDRS